LFVTDLWINEGRSFSGLDYYETQAIFESTREVNFGLVVLEISNPLTVARASISTGVADAGIANRATMDAIRIFVNLMVASRM